MTDCATLNDLINVIATLCPTLLCISTSLYTGAYLSALRHTSYYQFSGGKLHCEILAYPYILCVLSKNGRETPVSGIHVYTQMQDVTLRAKDQRS